MSTLQFAETYNMIALLEKPTESNGFHEIIDFLNANQIHYALTVNPTIYTSCIEQFWATAKAKTVNGERGRITNEIDCFPNATIFKELARIGYEKPSQRLTFYKAFFYPQWKFLIHTITQCLSAKTTAWNEFSNSGISTDSQQTPITIQPSSSRPQKKQSRRKQRKETKVPQDETHHDDSVPIPSNDPLLSETSKDAQAKEIDGLKKMVESSEDKDSLDAQEDASNQGRSFEDIDKDAEVSLVDETHGRTNDAEMFDTDDLHDSAAPTIPVTTAGEGVTATKIDEITLAQTLIEIKAAKPKVVGLVYTTE
ncbi:hypothetical protein Tco_0329059 [Tanacetum coccineum]